MKTIYLEIDDDMYEKVLSILKKLRGIKIKKQSIAPSSQKEKIEKLLKNAPKTFQNIDPLEYQKSIRKEWD